MPEIKTKAAAEKAVKTIDKSAIASQRMKNAYVRAMEKAVRTVAVDEKPPEEYAADQVSSGTTVATYESVRLFDRQGRKSVAVTKENIAKAKEYLHGKRQSAQPTKQTPKQVSHTPSPAVQRQTNVKESLIKGEEHPK